MQKLNKTTVFTALDASLQKKYSLQEARLRPFGVSYADLEVDFFNTPRPLLAMQLLELCSYTPEGSIGKDFFTELELGARMEALFALASLPYGLRLELCFTCEENSCQSKMEIEITSGEISALQRKALSSGAVEMKLGGKKISLRRPTGQDQLLWLRRGSASAVDMMADLTADENSRKRFETALADLSPQEKQEAISQTEELMEEADPLSHFSVTTSCPECNRQNSYRVNLEEICLRLLIQAQQKLLSGVHRLARAYHWSEREIFEIPSWRRNYYLQMLEREGGL